MRIPIIGGNWKMNRGSPAEASEMLKDFIPLVKDIKNVEIVICAPFTVLLTIKDLIIHSNVKLGAQNMYFEDKGAFTGEISPEFLISAGCTHVILGHSERRDIFKESDELINKKLKKAHKVGLIPIVCIGEHLEEREAGKTKKVVKSQMEETFKGLSKEQIINTIIAYEPIWAIGTGKTATPEQAEEVHLYIRQLLTEKYDQKTADAIRIQYGGSMKPNNAEDLIKQPNIDGGLVGGASLQAESLLEIIKAAKRAS
ncbi:MAG: triose-phosphate isomerase [Promethearchaeota archaeon]